MRQCDNAAAIRESEDLGSGYDTGRWLSVDPMAEKYPNMSSYNYVLNNPVNGIDPDGMEAETFIQESNRLFWGGAGVKLGTVEEQREASECPEGCPQVKNPTPAEIVAYITEASQKTGIPIRVLFATLWTEATTKNGIPIQFMEEGFAYPPDLVSWRNHGVSRRNGRKHAVPVMVDTGNYVENLVSTHDVGLMQLNPKNHMDVYTSLGFDSWSVMYDSHYNVMAGAKFLLASKAKAEETARRHHLSMPGDERGYWKVVYGTYNRWTYGGLSVLSGNTNRVPSEHKKNGQSAINHANNWVDFYNTQPWLKVLPVSKK